MKHWLSRTETMTPQRAAEFVAAIEIGECNGGERRPFVRVETSRPASYDAIVETTEEPGGEVRVDIWWWE